MSLPVSYFDTKLTGDILQRIEDNNRIEEFLTSASLSILFSFFNLVIFGIVLAIFHIKILALFITGSVLYIIWVSLFMKSRARLDHQRFRQNVPWKQQADKHCERDAGDKANPERVGQTMGLGKSAG